MTVARWLQIRKRRFDKWLTGDMRLGMAVAALYAIDKRTLRDFKAAEDADWETRWALAKRLMWCGRYWCRLQQLKPKWNYGPKKEAAP